MTYRIEFGSWPIDQLGNLFVHNFLALRDDTGKIVEELNGGAAGSDGSFNYSALTGPLTARRTVHADPADDRVLPRFATRPGSTFVELFSGTREEVLEKWNAGVACVDAINKKGLTYVATALNSNSVAGTTARCMDVKQPFVAPNDFSRPASQRQLLTNNEINTIRSQLSLPPIDDGKSKDAPNSEEPGKQGAVRRAPQFQDAQPIDQRPAFRSTDQATTPVAARTLLEDNMMIEDRAVADRMSAIHGLMADRVSEYWKGPKSDVLQQEYRDLVEAREKDKALRGSIALAPEAASTLIGSSMKADARPAPDIAAAADRMAELPGLMADRHSEYWSGPKADILQQEYRDLIDLRDRKKRREEQFFAYDDAS